ncbi:MAG: ferrous iron transport protein B [Mycoplasma sp.]
MNENKFKNYLLVGTPNIGKSTYFNKITWKTSPVGNIDRVTTFALSASLQADKKIKIIDLPGVLSLNATGDDEIETLKYIFSHQYEGVINIVSATTIRRDLMLTYELAEAGTLDMININMIDEMKDKQIKKILLTKEFKVMVNDISAKKNTNVKTSLRPLLNSSLKKPPAMFIEYSEKIEKFITKVEGIIPQSLVSKRFVIVQALQNNTFINNWLEESKIKKQFDDIKNEFNFTSLEINSIRQAKQDKIDSLYEKLLVDNSGNKISEKELITVSKFQKTLDSIFLNKYWSVPIFFLLIAFIWFITFYEYAGGWIQAYIAEDGLGALQNIISESIIGMNSEWTTQTWLASFVADGMLGGIFTVISFIPWIIILVFCMTILEQVGILSRMSIVFDKWFEKFGLSGRSIINIIAGVGCNIPSILMARNANSVKERVTTTLIMPFVSCSARVIVIAFISQVFVSSEYTWIFNLGITSLSWVFALLIGYLFSNILFRKTQGFFISELSPYRSPDMVVVIKKVGMEIYDFTKRVIIMVGVANLVVWFLQSTGPTQDFLLDLNDTNALQFSFLRYISIPFQILLYPTGLGEHWQLTISLVTAFPAKEIASSNIALIFGGEEEGINGFINFMHAIPLWRSTALSYITFFTFYIPCLATIAVMWKEVGKKYTLIHIGTSLLGTWALSMAVFSFGGMIESLIIGRNIIGPTTIIIMIGIMIVLYVTTYVYKQKKFKEETLWKLKELKLHNISFWTTNSLLMSSLIVANVLAFINIPS